MIAKYGAEKNEIDKVDFCVQPYSNSTTAKHFTFLVLWKVNIEYRINIFYWHKLSKYWTTNWSIWAAFIKTFWMVSNRLKLTLESNDLHFQAIIWKLFYNFIIDLFSSKLNSTITLMRQILKRSGNKLFSFSSCYFTFNTSNNTACYLNTYHNLQTPTGTLSTPKLTNLNLHIYYLHTSQ